MTAPVFQYIPSPGEWADDAACRGVDGNIFFPKRGQDVDRARRVCARCPVVGECLAYALRWRLKIGVYGGLSARERKAIWRRAS